MEPTINKHVHNSPSPSLSGSKEHVMDVASGLVGHASSSGVKLLAHTIGGIALDGENNTSQDDSEIDRDEDCDMEDATQNAAVKKGRGKYNPPSIENLKKAMVQRALGKSKAKAAKDNNINPSTFRTSLNRYAKNGKWEKKKPGPKKKVVYINEPMRRRICKYVDTHSLASYEDIYEDFS